MAGRAQHPHQPGGDDAALVVVGHDGVVVADPEPAHPAREHLRVGQRVPALLRARRGGEPVVELDEDGAGQVAAVVLGPARAPVEVPADVGEHELAEVGGGPGGVDDGSDHRPRLDRPQRERVRGGTRLEPVRREHGRAAGAGAEPVLGQVEVQPDASPGTRSAACGQRRGPRSSSAGPSARRAGGPRREPGAGGVGERRPAHLRPVAVLLRQDVRRLELVDGGGEAPDARGAAGVGVGLTRTAAEPLDVVERRPGSASRSAEPRQRDGPARPRARRRRRRRSRPPSARASAQVRDGRPMSERRRCRPACGRRAGRVAPTSITRCVQRGAARAPATRRAGRSPCGRSLSVGARQTSSRGPSSARAR